MKFKLPNIIDIFIKISFTKQQKIKIYKTILIILIILLITRIKIKYTIIYMFSINVNIINDFSKAKKIDNTKIIYINIYLVIANIIYKNMNMLNIYFYVNVL